MKTILTGPHSKLQRNPVLSKEVQRSQRVFLWYISEVVFGLFCCCSYALILIIVTACGEKKKKFQKLSKAFYENRSHTVMKYYLKKMFARSIVHFFNPKILFFSFLNNSTYTILGIAAFFSTSKNILVFWIEPLQRTPGYICRSPHLCASTCWQFSPQHRSWIPSMPRSAGKYDSDHTPTNTQTLQPH